MTRSIQTDTALGFRNIHKHQAVLILTQKPGKTWRGVILSPGQTRSLVRYNEDGELRERKLENTSLVPVKIPKTMAA